MVSQTKSRKTFFFFILLGFFVVIPFLFHNTILTAAGNFLAPEGIGNADVVILEGTELIEEKGIEISMSLLSSGRANHLVIIYQSPEDERVFARPLNYNLFLIQRLETLGLKKDQIRVIGVPNDHPVTLTEAQIVTSHLSMSEVKSAILIAESFHMRRSLWTYQKICLPKGIKIIPYPYFIRYRADDWWKESQGVYEFGEELFKFFYYVLRGYVPIKSLLVT